MAEWFYSQAGQQKGPVSREALGQLAANGPIGPADLVWTAGMPAWQPAGQVAGLFAAAPAGGPPPLPPQGVPIGYAGPPPYGAHPGQRLGDDAAVRMLLPVGRSGWAIAAGYLGLISVLLVPAPLALVCAVLAIRDIRRHPDRHGMGRAVFGLIMGSLFTIALGVMIVAAITNHLRP